MEECEFHLPLCLRSMHLRVLIPLQGYTELLELLKQHREQKGNNLPVDIYGTGEDLEAIKARAQEYELEVHFMGARDHLENSIHPYR